MDLDLPYLVFHSAKGILAAFISVVCICRAAKFDSRAKRGAVWTMVLLGMSAFGLGFSMLMPKWMAHVCTLLFMGSICGMLAQGEYRWRNGPPDDLLREEHQFPQSDRRHGKRRRTDFFLSTLAAIPVTLWNAGLLAS